MLNFDATHQTDQEERIDRAARLLASLTTMQCDADNLDETVEEADVRDDDSHGWAGRLAACTGLSKAAAWFTSTARRWASSGTAGTSTSEESVRCPAGTSRGMGVLSPAGAMGTADSTDVNDLTDRGKTPRLQRTGNGDGARGPRGAPSRGSGAEANAEEAACRIHCRLEEDYPGSSAQFQYYGRPSPRSWWRRTCTQLMHRVYRFATAFLGLMMPLLMVGVAATGIEGQVQSSSSPLVAAAVNSEFTRDLVVRLAQATSTSTFATGSAMVMNMSGGCDCRGFAWIGPARVAAVFDTGATRNSVDQ